jgi:hypothetical protein
MLGKINGSAQERSLITDYFASALSPKDRQHSSEMLQQLEAAASRRTTAS